MQNPSPTLDSIASLKDQIVGQLNDVRAQVMPRVLPVNLDTELKKLGVNRKGRRAYLAAKSQKPGKDKTRGQRRR